MCQGILLYLTPSWALVEKGHQHSVDLPAGALQRKETHMLHHHLHCLQNKLNPSRPEHHLPSTVLLL